MPCRDSIAIPHFTQETSDCSILCSDVRGHGNTSPPDNATCITPVQSYVYRHDSYVYKADSRYVHVLPSSVDNHSKRVCCSYGQVTYIQKVFDPYISVMFRFLPTILEEYRAIHDAMRLREIGSWRNPIEMLEYRMVPLLTGLVTIGNELSTSALTRGLDAPVQRTNICPIGFHWQDGVALLFCIAVIICFILSTFCGW
jgi:hypothetical protein